MRVNIYAEEMTNKVELIEKTTKDGTFVGVRFWLELPVTQPVVHPDLGVVDITHVQGPFMHHADDNDSAAVTFWGKAQLKAALRKALDLLEAHGGIKDGDTTIDQAFPAIQKSEPAAAASKKGVAGLAARVAEAGGTEKPEDSQP